MKKSTLVQILNWTVYYTLLVILWGAWVRISHSGDGCGDTWPLCTDRLIPNSTQGKTWIEYTHRLMSGFYGILIVMIWFSVKKHFAGNKTMQFWKNLSLLFMITEALLGAKLVLSGLVAQDDSAMRSFVMAAHMMNSLALMGSTAILALHAQYPEARPRPMDLFPFKILKEKSLFYLVILFAVLCATGAIASLSTTLFPAHQFFNELLKDFSADSHYLIKLRGAHPLLGIFFGGTLGIGFYIYSQNFSQTTMQMRVFRVAALTIFQVLLGFSAILLHSPIWLKLFHLLGAHALWLSLISFLFHRKFVSTLEGTSTKPILFFDGVCNLCNRFVDFVVSHKPTFQVASLQGQTSQKLFKDSKIEVDSIRWIDNSQILLKSDAVLVALGHLEGISSLAPFLLIIPSFLRDFVYDIVAKNRYKIFGERSTCRMPLEEEKTLFLP